MHGQLQHARDRPHDQLGYARKWIAFQKVYMDVLPAIPVYSNLYIDFFTPERKDYDINMGISWSETIKGSAVIFSLIETAKENGLDPYRYLVYVLTKAPKLSTQTDQWAKQLTPECCKQTNYE